MHQSAEMLEKGAEINKNMLSRGVKWIVERENCAKFAESPNAFGTAHRPAADLRFWISANIYSIFAESPNAFGTAHRPSADLRFWISANIH